MKNHKESKDRNCQNSVQNHKGSWPLRQNIGFLQTSVVGHSWSLLVCALNKESTSGSVDTGGRAMNKVDLVSGEEEGFLSSTSKTQGCELKELEADIKAMGPFAKKCETNCNSNKWRGLVTGLTFRKQSRLLCLLQSRNPQPFTRPKREKTKIEPSQKYILHRLLATPCCVNAHLLNLGLITRGVSRREVYLYGGNRLFPELEKPLFVKPIVPTNPSGKWWVTSRDAVVLVKARNILVGMTAISFSVFENFWEQKSTLNAKRSTCCFTYNWTMGVLNVLKELFKTLHA